VLKVVPTGSNISQVPAAFRYKEDRERRAPDSYFLHCSTDAIFNQRKNVSFMLSAFIFKETLARDLPLILFLIPWNPHPIKYFHL